MVNELHENDFTLDAEEDLVGLLAYPSHGHARRDKSLLGNNLDGSVFACARVSCNLDATYHASEGVFHKESYIIPELPFPIVLPSFQQPIIFGSSRLDRLECLRGAGFSAMGMH
jgi:hypothetical protein